MGRELRAFCSNPPTFRLGVSDLVLGGGLPPPTPSALTPVPAERPGNGQNASACRGKGDAWGLKTLKTRTPRGGGVFGEVLKSEWAFSPTGRGKRQSGDLACSGGVIRGRCLALLGPIEPFSSTGKGKSESQPPHDCLFLDRQGEKGIASACHNPMIAVSSTGRGKRNRKRMAMFP